MSEDTAPKSDDSDRLKKEIRSLKDSLKSARDDARELRDALKSETALREELERRCEELQGKLGAATPHDGCVIVRGECYLVAGEPRTVKAAVDDMQKGFIEEDRVVVPIDRHHGI